MSLTWEPVNPERHASRRTEVLGAQGQSVPVEDAKYTGVNVSSYYFDLKTMLELDFKGMGQYEHNLHVAFFMLEIACYTETVLVTSIETGALALERRGLAVRVGIANWGVEFRAAATLGAVAANAQLALSSTALQVVINGGGEKVIEIATPITRLTNFTAEGLQTISECTAKLADYFASDGKTLVPVPLAVAPLDVGEFSWANTLFSGQLAVESIWRDRSANDSLNIAASRPADRKYLVPGYVRSVYTSLGLRDGFERPSREQRDTAMKMLSEGRY